MATPDQLLKKDKDQLDLPGVDPITESSFAPGNPPDPGSAPPIPKPTPVESPKPYFGTPPELRTGPFSPGQRAELAKEAYDWQSQQNLQAADELKQINDDRAGIYQNAAQQQELRRQEAEQDSLASRAAVQARLEAMDQAIARGKEMKIDPDRYWNRKGTFSAVLSAISVGLGALGQGVGSGAGNPGMTLLQNALERDVKAQQSEIDSYWKGVQQQYALVDNEQNFMKAKEDFNRNNMLASWKVVDFQLAQNEARTKNPELKAKFADMRVGVHEKLDKLNKEDYEYQMYLLAERRKAMAAAANSRALMAKERNNKQQELQLEYVKQGLSPDEANAQAWKSVDTMFPQLQGTSYQSPTQKFDSAYQVSLSIKNAKSDKDAANMLVKLNPQLSKVPSDQLMALAKDMRNASDAEIRQALVAQGVVDPFASASTSASGAGQVIDSVTGRPVSVTNKNRGMVVTGPDGQQYLMPNDNAVKNTSAIKSLVDSMDSDLDHLAALAVKAKVESSTLGPGNVSNVISMSKEDRLKMDNARYRIAAAAAKLKNPTAEPSDAVIEQNLGNIPDITSLSIGDPSVWVENYRKAAKADAYTTFNAYSGGAQVGSPQTQVTQSVKTTKSSTSGDPFTLDPSLGPVQPQAPKGGSFGGTPKPITYSGPTSSVGPQLGGK